MSKVLVALCLLIVLAVARKDGTSCNDAIELQMTALYTADTSRYGTSAVSCGTYMYNPPGVWYHFIGDGATFIGETCDERTNFDTVVFVFDSCKEVKGYINSCVAMDDDSCNEKQSRVKFFAERGGDYYVFVTGFLNNTGTYFFNAGEN